MFDQNCSDFYGCKALTIYIISTRATAIMYMRRAGLSWGTIIKITGHRSVATVVKNYDLKLEAKGENWLGLDEVNRKVIVTLSHSHSNTVNVTQGCHS